METYRRKVYLDKDNYIIKYSMDLDGKHDYDLTIEILHSERLNCWQLVGDEFVFDTEKEHEQQEQEQEERERQERESLRLEAQVTYTAMMTDTLLED